MSISGSVLLRGIFVSVTALACVNALAPFGNDAARWVVVVLQAVVGIGTLVGAAVVARRTTGASRWWRVLVIAASLTWLVGEVLWWASGAGGEGRPAPPLAVAAYFLPPVLSLAAMALLTRSGGGLGGHQDGPVRLSRVLAILDGLVAATAFAIVVFSAGLGATTAAALPRSKDIPVVLTYAALELTTVVVAVVMAMAYRRDRPYRANYLLLSGGVLLIAGSERLVVYLQTVGLAAGGLWVGVGFIVGQLMIGIAVLDLPPRSDGGRVGAVMDWVPSVLPYGGFLGVVVLCAFHVLIGERLSPVVVFIGVMMVLLVTTRQVVAMRAQRVLTQRLFEAQRRLAHQVHHDSLTGLPNRVLFAERLDGAMRHGKFVLIFVDIDDFKEVNDKYGHAAGDDLLCAVGTRLRGCVGSDDTLARIGGDEFAILIENEYEAPEVVADRLRVALRDPFAVHGSSVRVRASMGLVHSKVGDSAPTSDDLMRQADVSMYEGKRLGKDTAVVYRPTSGVAVDFPSTLRRAAGGVPSGFSLCYQPVVRLPDGDPVALEALARWSAPNGMQIPPETFVAVAESAGLGATLDAMVLELACDELQESGLAVDLHVNVGAARLGNKGFEQRVMRALERHGIGPERLVLEITETVPIVDLSEGAEAIARLRSNGVRVALDDFGAGFNSLSYLHALPVEVVKLDRSLLVGAKPDQDLALYRSVIGLCSDLGMQVIAEGIEHAAQADTVFAAGCRLAQGYLFGRAKRITEVGW